MGYDLTDQNPTRSSSGSVICIEGLAYGDGQSEEDYAEYVPFIFLSNCSAQPPFVSKLVKQLKTSAPDTPLALKKAPTSMHATSLSSLSVRIGEPYWLLHQGNCEHFVVVDQVRLEFP